MLKQRLELRQRLDAVYAVRDAAMASELAQDRAAIAAARCLVTALEQRVVADLPLATGLEAINLLSQSVSLSVAAREKIIMAHAKLAEVPHEIGVGVTGWGDTGCPPMDKPTGARLSTVG